MPSRRSRIFSRPKKVTGGGGGSGGVTGLLAIGPNYGQAGDTHATTTSIIAPNQYDLTFDNQHAITTNLIAPNTYELIFTTQFATTSTVNAPIYQRNYLAGSNVVTQTAGTTWASITNAQGLNNGTNATYAGSLTAATAGTLNLAYTDIPDYTTFGFTIVSAFLDFYSAQAGTVLANGNLAHAYSVGGATTTLATFTGNITNAPASYDITSAIINQTTLNALTAYVSKNSAAANASTATCDAVVLRMVVTHV